ncbi:MAG: hypothetical protein Kow0092_30590 [Deferrisomatales bacterium]
MGGVRVLLCVALAATALGCADGSGDGRLPVVRAGDLLSSPRSDLVLEIPPDLPPDAGEPALEAIFRDVHDAARCRTPSGEPVDLLLGQVCAAFDRLYLFPENLPDSLEGLASASQFVDAVRQRDPFSRYYPAEEFETLVSPSLSGDKALIGIRLAIDGDAPVVGPEAPLRIAEVLPFYRGWFDGLLPGDILLEVHRPPEVEHRSVEGLTLDEAVALLPSAEGESVELTVERGGARVTVATAAETHLSFFVADGVGYLGVRRYTTRSAEQVESDFRALEDHASVDRLVLDLRGNGGGSVTGALALTDYLVDQDLPPRTHPITTFDGTLLHDAARYLGEHFSENLSGWDPATFVVLVDGSTASASEITVAALRHYGVAAVLGETTFGKGIRQETELLADGSAAVIPSHHILPPSGISYHEVGIEPDIPVAGAASGPPEPLENDPQLAAAVAYLRTGRVPEARASAAPRRRGGPAPAPVPPGVF